MTSTHRNAVLVMVAALGLGAGAFVFARSTTDQEKAVAQDATATPSQQTTESVPAESLSINPDRTKPLWHIPYLEAEASRPLFDGTIAGIRIGYGASPASYACPVTRSSDDLSRADGTPLELRVESPPQPFIGVESVNVSTCADGSVASAEATYLIAGEPPAGRLGGSIRVFRHTGGPTASLAIAAERWSEEQVAGSSAAVAEPILPGLGLGQGAVVTYREGVLTLVHAVNIPLTEVLAVAEELVR